ncbi:MAG: DUF3455 domain-containing protein [Verrucomicrobia bacterium]|nr:DUF3455 domain-containing protein [Verrucomicrobiota bacterium]
MKAPQFFLTLTATALVLSGSALAQSAAAPAKPADAKATAPAVPDALKVDPAKFTLVVTLTGTGTQTYEAKPKKDDATKFEWVLKAPAAELVDAATGKKFGKHYAGPTFEAADGSKIVGKITNKAPAPNAADLDWVLVETNSTGGPGALAKVVLIRRLNTKGGKAPATAEASDVGKEKVVPYSTTYECYAAK